MFTVMFPVNIKCLIVRIDYKRLNQDIPDVDVICIDTTPDAQMAKLNPEIPTK